MHKLHHQSNNIFTAYGYTIIRNLDGLYTLSDSAPNRGPMSREELEILLGTLTTQQTLTNAKIIGINKK